MDNTDGPRWLELESGVVRPVFVLGVERAPGWIGGLCGMMMGCMAWYGECAALKGLWLVAIWFAYWRLAREWDPQYWEVLWRNVVTYPWPSFLASAPGVLAKEVKVEASVPVKG